MILSKNINFRNFTKIKKDSILKKKLGQIIYSNNEILKSLGPNYKYSFSKKIISKLKKNFSTVKLIGIGGSILGTKAIYNFLHKKVKKNFLFIDNLADKKFSVLNEKKTLNIIISKSGNTLETILNTNIFVTKKSNNIFITEKKIIF